MKAAPQINNEVGFSPKLLRPPEVDSFVDPRWLDCNTVNYFVAAQLQ